MQTNSAMTSRCGTPRYRWPGLLATGLLVILGGGFSAGLRADEFPPELTRFEPDSRNPVFTAEGPGNWDVKIRERGWILHEGDLWKMWFTGYDGTRPGKKMLGYATSTDGIAWQRYPQNPIYSETWVEDVCVVPHQGTYYMFAEGEEDQVQLLTSSNGIEWKHQGRVDVRQANGEPISAGPYGTPTAWYENGQWNLFYERSDKGIWLARSTDLKIFTNVQDEPILKMGPSDYDLDQIAMNQVICDHGRYYAVLHGAKKPADPTKPSVWSTSLATSTDLIHWQKFAGNPLRPIAENKSSGLLIKDGSEYRLYTMHNEVNLHRSSAVGGTQETVAVSRQVSKPPELPRSSVDASLTGPPNSSPCCFTSPRVRGLHVRLHQGVAQVDHRNCERIDVYQFPGCGRSWPGRRDSGRDVIRHSRRSYR